MFSFKMDDEKLIELVERHVALYDYKDPLYSDYSHKKKIWNEIGEELKQSSSVCKTRWNNIRDNYRKTLRRVTVAQEEDPSKIKKYRFAEMLKFLDNHFHERDNSSSVNSDYEQDMDTIENVGVKIELIEEPEEIDSNAFSQQEQGYQSHLGMSPLHYRRKSLSENGNSFLVINGNNDTHTGLAFDAVDAFLGAIAPTLKTFSPYYLNIAKSKIFSIVQQYEMKVLQQQQKRSTIHTSPTHNNHSTQISENLLSTEMPEKPSC